MRLRLLSITVAALAATSPVLAAPKLRAWVTTGDKSQLLAAQAPVAASSAEALAGLPVIAVDAQERHQSIVGFGASITDASAWLIQNKLKPADRKSVV